MTKIKTYLPIFSGFYSTIWELNTENYEYSEGVDYDQLEVDYKGYETAIVEAIASEVSNFCPLIKNIEVENVVSPREYNFANDSANVIIDVDVRALNNYLNTNKDALQVYIKNRYTSCSGFISSYSNDVDDWLNLDSESLEGHKLGALLDFWFENEDVNEWLIYDHVEVSEYEYITTIEKEIEDLTTSETVEIAAEILANDIDNVVFHGYIDTLKIMAIQEHGEGWAEYLADKYPSEVIAAYEGDIKAYLESV